MAFQLVGASVAIITTNLDGEVSGLTVTSFCSMSLEPPTMLVCVNQKAGAHDKICNVGWFGINVLRPGQEAIANRFSGTTGVRGHERFTGGDWSLENQRVPMLLGVAAFFECEMIRHISCGTHTVFIGRINRVFRNSDKEALLYCNRKYRALPVTDR